MSVSHQEILDTLDSAELIYSESEVERALDSMAHAISCDLSGKSPVILCSMLGGLVTTGALLQRMHFPLTIDYIHPTRYHGTMQGTELNWISHASASIEGKVILVVDDILDKGITLSAIIEDCKQAGAAEIHSAVLVEKKCPKQVDVNADYVGLSVDDRYVFGYGMDYKGYWRNAPGIYAVSETG